jgi:hypothetical protein
MYFPAERTLYAVIFADGQIDYMDTAHHDLAIRHGKITRVEVAKMKRAMETTAFKEFQGIIQSEHQRPHQDYQTNLEVAVYSPLGMRSFTLRGFDPEDGRPFPSNFNEFLCIVDNLKRVEYRLSSGCK